MNGVLVIDKPEGLTSHDVVRKIRRACCTRRVGHAGTLDPMATGLLLVAVGEATRIVEYMMEGEKTYRATLQFGTATDTQDASGRIVDSRPPIPCNKEDLRRVMNSFVGEQQQVPPMYSALKKNGVALHRLARQGLEVERKPRTIFITRLELIDTDWPRVTFEVDCSKGTYVRTLCHDIGLRLKTVAHMTELRRIRSGSFHLEEAVTLEKIERGRPEDIPELLLPLAAGLRDFPRCQLSQEAIRKLSYGIPPLAEEISPEGPLASGDVVVLVDGNRALAIGRYDPQRTREQRGDIELFKVFQAGSQPLDSAG